jgi:GT2 family glycosyltransferase
MSGFREMRKPDVFCVLAMHRSGSSLLTRLLNLLGLCLGSEDRMLPLASDNPKGHWENQEIVRINDEILTKLGGNWHEPPSLEPGWEIGSELDDLKQRARELLQYEFGDASVWGWKDPRNCLTLPFWQQLLPKMRYVVCMRNPVDVASSLQNREGFSLIKGSDLWSTYMNSAFEHIDGQARLLVFYEDIMDDWLREFRRLAAFLGNPGRAEEIEAQTAAREFVEHKLQHYRSTIVDTAANPTVSLRARRLFVAHRICSSTGRGAVQNQDETDDRIEKALGLLSLYSDDSPSRSTGLLLEHLAETERMLADSLDTIRDFDTRLSAAQEESAPPSFAAESAESVGPAESAEAAVATSEQLIAELSIRLEQKEEVIQRLLGEVEKRERQLRQIRGTLGWRILSLYGPIKYGIIKPLLRFLIRRPNRQPADDASYIDAPVSEPPQQDAGQVEHRLDSAQPQQAFEAAQWRPPPSGSPQVDVIVCVSAPIAIAKRHLQALIERTPPRHPLLMVDDGGADEVRTFLVGFALAHGAMLLRNDFPAGFASSAEKALCHSSANYVVLLSGDVEVSPGWLERMLACAESDSLIGIVGPLSNYDPPQPFPQSELDDWIVHEATRGKNSAHDKTAVSEMQAQSYPRLPFISGICLMIKRAVVDEVGLPNAGDFGEWFVGEADYRLRVRKAGWRIALADDVYVYYVPHQDRLAMKETTRAQSTPIV